MWDTTTEPYWPLSLDAICPGHSLVFGKEPNYLWSEILQRNLIPADPDNMILPQFNCPQGRKSEGPGWAHLAMSHSTVRLWLDGCSGQTEVTCRASAEGNKQVWGSVAWLWAGLHFSQQCSMLSLEHEVLRIAVHAHSVTASEVLLKLQLLLDGTSGAPALVWLWCVETVFRFFFRAAQTLTRRASGGRGN